MQLSVEEIAKLLNGKIDGKTSVKIDNVARLTDANATSLSFLANSKYEKYLYTSNAGAVLAIEDFKPKKDTKTPLIIRVEDPYAAFAVILEQFERSVVVVKHGVEQPVFLSSSSSIGKNVYLGAFTYIADNVSVSDDVKIYPQVYLGENVRIGKGTVIFPGVKIYANSQIGSFCTLEAGAIIGSEGFGFVSRQDGSLKQVPQIGNVTLGDHVSIGANTTIDRATVGSTSIESGVKLDNLVHIGHNVVIGNDSAVAAQAGIAGSTSIGKNCMLGGQVGIVGHLDIANKTQIGPKGGIMSSIKEEGRILLGAPAMDFAHTKKVWVIWKKLPELQKRLESLEDRVKSSQPK